MVGLVTSLNVSVAAALILFEAQRQRLDAGLYERSRLPRELFERTIFEWAYPRLAEHCRRKGLAYPALSIDGEPVEPIPR
jgi:tRNA (guanosine-2'-O-)-methyltransferase